MVPVLRTRVDLLCNLCEPGRLEEYRLEVAAGVLLLVGFRAGIYLFVLPRDVW